MPKILINEVDNTSAGTPGGYGNYAVLLTGYQKQFSDDEITAAETLIESYNDVMAQIKEGKVDVTIPTLSDAAQVIKARKEKADENGVYEFSSQQDFLDTIGAVEPGYKVEDNSETEINEHHYGNRMARELLNLGYQIIYKPISYSAEMNNEKFWAIFKDKASYDFRFISHGLLESDCTPADIEALEKRQEELQKDEAKLLNIKTKVEESDAYKNAETDEAKSELIEASYAKVISKEADGEGYEGFKDKSGLQYSTYKAASSETNGVYAELQQVNAAIDEHNKTHLTKSVFNDINGQIAKLAAYKKDKANVETLCDGRGDCTALIELDEKTYNIKTDDRPEVLIAEGINNMSSVTANEGAYCAMTVPSVYYKMDGEAVKFPGAFHYLACFMGSLSSGFAEWYAAAGYTRGVSSYVIDHTPVKLGEIAINTLEPRNIDNDPLTVQPKFACNVIANFRGSYYLWGNRTAAELGYAIGGADLTAEHFLNIRQLCSTIKKQLYINCRRFTFDPNSDTLWINFVNAITPTLDAMKADQGVKDYRVEKEFTDKKATLKAKIRIIPIEAVEDFDLTVSLEDSFGGVSVTVEG